MSRQKLYQNRWFLGSLIFLCLSTLLSPFVTGLAGWIPGVAYIFYDTFLIAMVMGLIIRARADVTESAPLPHPPPPLSILISARNESAVIVACLEALRPQLRVGDEVLMVDDGSTDDSLEKLRKTFHLQSLSLREHTGELSLVQNAKASLRVFQKSNSGKANSLNLIWPLAKNEILVTLDADTILEGGALIALRQAFAKNPWLVACCGILTPTTRGGWRAKTFEAFQHFEYVRAFLSRFAWGRVQSLLIVSGAFAAYRKSALQSVGGYDAHNLVEDYELIHRLHRYSDDQGMNWQILVIPQARAKTDAPDSVFKFLKQRQRWFAGFLQTQFGNSDMIGNPKYRIGRFMLIVKSFDTLQPLFGLVAVAILILSLARGLRIAGPLLILIFAKIVMDLIFHFWSVYVYYRWRDQKVTDAMWFRAALATIFEPFSFQILRHLGAAFGWVAFLRKNREWTPQRSSLERPEAARVPDRNP